MVQTLPPLSHILQECQQSMSCHRKNAALFRQHLLAASKHSAASAGSGQEGMRAFQELFFRGLKRVLAVKKREPAVERLIKFFVTVVVYLQQKEVPQSSGMESQFLNAFLRYLLNGVDVKDKSVRLRSCQLLALCIDNIEEMDEDVFEEIREKMLIRVRDKEAQVRIQAVLTLSKFQANDEEEDGEELIEDILLKILQCDPSGDVRKTVLCNLEVSKKTIPYILERLGDTDAAIRKCVFRRSMAEIGDMRVFSIEERERILDMGLTDRDPDVRKACTDMIIGVWVKQCNNNIIEFLSRLDVMTSDVAEDVLNVFLEAHPDVVFQFDDTFWDNLTVDTAFLMRVFYQYAVKNQVKDLDDILPEVSKHALRIQTYVNRMFEVSTDEEDLAASMEFIVEQLLKMALSLDLSDEVGRRNLFGLMRKMLEENPLTPELLSVNCDILKRLCANETDFMLVMIENISDLTNPHTQVDDDEEDSDDPAADVRFGTLRSLQILHQALQRTTQNLEHHPFLGGFLMSHVVPAVQSDDPELQMAAIHCLIQYCLLDKNMALQNVDFFVNIMGGDSGEELQMLGFRTVLDFTLLYGFEQVSVNASDDIADEFKSLLEVDTKSPLQAVVVEGFTKLFLLTDFQDQKILEAVVELYFAQSQQEVSSIGQCLSIFFRVYPTRRTANRSLLAHAISSVMFDILEEYKSETITALQMATLMLDWVVPVTPETVAPDFYLDLALSLCASARGSRGSAVKTCISLLNRLPLDRDENAEKRVLLVEALEKMQGEIRDKLTLNALGKLKAKVEQGMDEVEVDGEAGEEEPPSESSGMMASSEA